ncbi:hypothetical protein PL9631_940085 [Planktothrix paucivesiculata PCC 9631]|uniref:Uncharacterized protein n=1 Tax=Planktothrix paucivesiculata PCC 9631 TaxID=671071 RepID=A0A7Z9C0X7_9CYAN|nr:hypothetical protein PL9631_940085 [Planktothrix paucivesiculata PCC 9631]
MTLVKETTLTRKKVGLAKELNFLLTFRDLELDKNEELEPDGFGVEGCMGDEAEWARLQSRSICCVRVGRVFICLETRSRGGAAV